MENDFRAAFKREKKVTLASSFGYLIEIVV